MRHYTYGGDLAKGIVRCMEGPEALNEDFIIWSVSAAAVAFRRSCDPVAS